MNVQIATVEQHEGRTVSTVLCCRETLRGVRPTGSKGADQILITQLVDQWGAGRALSMDPDVGQIRTAEHEILIDRVQPTAHDRRDLIYDLRMPTPGERVERRNRELFVGRQRELDRFDAILDGDAVHVVHLTGVGGIGKSALLREVTRRAVAKQFAVLWLDGRDLPLFPAVIETALEPVHTNGPTLVVIDSYEMVSSLDNRLRELIIPELPESTIVIMASRQRPSVGWFDGGWDALFQAMTLDGLSLDELRQLAAAHAGSGDTIAEGALEAFLRNAHGSPLAVVVGAQTGGIGSVAELADRLLGNEVETDRYRTLSVAAIARVTTPELLEAVHPGSDGHESYKWAPR